MVDFDPKYLAPGPVSDHHLHGDLKKYLYVTDPHVANHRMRFKLLLDTIRGIAYIHSQRIVHGDLKAQNILAAGDGEVAKICYFGSSAIECACYAHPENRPAGTPQWYSPELWISTKEDDDDIERSRTQQSDIWAFGCVTLEVQMGMMPWDPFYKGSQHGTMSRQQRAGTGPPATAEGLELGEHPIKQRKRPSAAQLLRDWEEVATNSEGV
ncbi:Tyrosine kinase specific for activated [Rhizoctonia solani]|uniref:Tyrosine kinase specific for activated n=1 Tax=Rhizoctonia solani TaxID=456999 RepID=A0A8H8T1J0_9AGAM|nr:Tyrosine kinase specific for activated [Rhizoctonia solani]QRW25874.1 Tyrosine kinase specific for activated [Rhizoctonia solani]